MRPKTSKFKIGILILLPFKRSFNELKFPLRKMQTFLPFYF